MNTAVFLHKKRKIFDPSSITGHYSGQGQSGSRAYPVCIGTIHPGLTCAYLSSFVKHLLCFTHCHNFHIQCMWFHFQTIHLLIIFYLFIFTFPPRQLIFMCYLFTWSFSHSFIFTRVFLQLGRLISYLISPPQMNHLFTWDCFFSCDFFYRLLIYFNVIFFPVINFSHGIFFFQDSFIFISNFFSRWFVYFHMWFFFTSHLFQCDFFFLYSFISTSDCFYTLFIHFHMWVLHIHMFFTCTHIILF